MNPDPMPATRSPQSLLLLAPMTGWVTPLSEVPDPVFSSKMMGDGIAIDPTEGRITAPCDGEIITLHQARHAVTLRTDFNAEILIHLGLETVALQGRGFTPHVVPGQRVTAGQTLISFDLDVVAMGARSLISPIIVTNGELFAIIERRENCKIVAGQPLLTLQRLGDQRTTDEGSAAEVRRSVIIPLVHGIHARPAARLADRAKLFDARLSLASGERRANLRSPVALMGLGLVKGAEATLIGQGKDAEAAIDAIATLILSGMGETEAEKPVSPAVSPAAKPDGEPGVVVGVCASPGVALGRAVRLAVAEITVTEEGQGANMESQALREAISRIKARLASAAAGRGPEAAIMGAHLAFLDDPDLADLAQAAILRGKTAAFAWRSAVQQQIALLRGVEDPRFVERIADLADLERQILVALGCSPQEETLSLPAQAILLADDLLPSQLVGLDSLQLAGLATARGGPTSHVAIIAASMGIPALVACGEGIRDIAAGTQLLIDADAGRLVIAPAADVIRVAEDRIAVKASRRAAAQALAHRPCLTRDGVRIEIAANLGSLADAEKAVAAGAEACGLLRTEFLFLERQSPPDETEQAAVYGAIAKVLDGRPMVIRTLDIGGDKPADYLPIPAEENPALGLRGVRVSLWRPDLLDIQLRAIVTSVPPAQCRIMLPMIASLSEFRLVRDRLDAILESLGIADRIELGVMIETPAAAVTADILAAEADFLSVGTNDLSQYSLAMDRGNPAVAAGIDALHPGVLRLIAQAAAGAALHGRWTGVCGGLASDLGAVPILIGLGVRELSVTSGQIADIKALVSSVTLDHCQSLARLALAAASPGEIRALTSQGPS